MSFEGNGLLTVTVFLPLVAAVLIAFVVKRDQLVRYCAGVVALVELGLSIAVFTSYDLNGDRFQHIDRVSDWISVDGFEVQYFLGVDGLSAPLVLLAGILGMTAIFASWGINKRVREYFVWLLVLQTAVMGVFTALDFILFFFFWELELIPMFFLISIWGSGRREYSAMKFVVFTFLGSAFMLVGILALFFSTGIGTFDMTVLPDKIQAATLILPSTVVFTLLFIGFAVKLPVWPLHTWLPDAHTDAPTAVSVMLAGVLLKMGGYGMIRVSAGMFPEVIKDVAWVLVSLGVINVLYGAMITLRQTDLKRLVAFSSISHMGYVLIGVASVAGVAGTISPIGLTGAAMQMFTHGTITGLMFLLVGLVYDKTHTREIPELGGLASRMPLIAVAFMVAGLASLGLPGTSGFVAEILVFLGAFPVWSWATALGAFGIVITAGYILWMIQRTFFGPTSVKYDRVGDATRLEMVPIFVLVAVVIGVGVYPSGIANVFTEGVSDIVQTIQYYAAVPQVQLASPAVP